MVERGIKSILCNSIDRYVKANIKYMKDYQKKLRILLSYILAHK